MKTLVLLADNEPVVALVRGDHELNEIKLKNILGCTELEMAGDEVVTKVTGAPVGFAGPVGLEGEDRRRPGGEGDEELRHRRQREGPPPEEREPGAGFPGHPLRRHPQRGARRCLPALRGGHLEMWRGIEVGHVFKLGTKYSKALKATFLDADGKEQIIFMGCYGIGIGRTVAACIEQNHDENGIIFPIPIAPFQCIVSALNIKEDAGQGGFGVHLPAALEAGVEVLLDDRDERPGFKFKDADLIGIPLRIVVGSKNLAQGNVELKDRKSGEVSLLPIAEAVEKVKALVADALKSGQ